MRLSKKVEHASRPNEKRPGLWRGRLIMCTPGAAQTKQELQRAYLRCLRALGAVFDFKLNFLTFIQAAVAATFDCREMCEHVSAARVRSNETETFVGIKQFNFALLSHV